MRIETVVSHPSLDRPGLLPVRGLNFILISPAVLVEFLLSMLTMFRGFSSPGRPLLAMLAISVPLFSTALLQLDLAEMTTASTEIVQGTVTGSSVAMSGRTIFTHYRILVSQRFKGPNQPTTDVAIPGGSLRGVRQSFPGVPVLQTGRRYMLFLWQGKTGPNQPVGLQQGVLEVGPGEKGETMVFRNSTGETMLDAGHRPVFDSPVRMRLSEMRSRVSVAVSGGAGR